jgi:chemotaxis protein CheX
MQADFGWPALLEVATREVFEIMVGSKLRVRTDVGSTRLEEFTVTVGLSGELRGLIGFHCSAASACRLASRMLQVDTHEFNDQALDAIGEICNMVAGNLKAKLPGVGDKCNISTPTIISGSDYHLHQPPRTEHFAICLDFDGSPIWVTLDLKK